MKNQLTEIENRETRLSENYETKQLSNYQDTEFSKRPCCQKCLIF